MENDKIVIILIAIIIIVAVVSLIIYGNNHKEATEIDYWKTEIILPEENGDIIQENIEMEENM